MLKANLLKHEVPYVSWKLEGSNCSAIRRQRGPELIVWKQKHSLLFWISLLILAHIRKGTAGAWQPHMEPCLHLSYPQNWPPQFFTTLLYLLSWESELLARSLHWGKLGNAATCCDAEGRSEAVVDTTPGREPPEGSEEEGSVLGAATDEVAVTS